MFYPNSAIKVTEYPYGAVPALCYGTSINYKRVLKRGLLVGIDLGYEMLRSKVRIDKIVMPVNPATGFQFGPYDAEGTTYLSSSFLNANPFIGYRGYMSKKLPLDFLVGTDLGYCLSAREQGKATTRGIEVETDEDQKMIHWDVRPRLQIAAEYKRLGCYVGYSYGLTHYDGPINKAESSIKNDAYSQIFRFGLSYRLK
jgi:hypothetical protein